MRSGGELQCNLHISPDLAPTHSSNPACKTVETDNEAGETHQTTASPVSCREPCHQTVKFLDRTTRTGTHEPRRLPSSAAYMPQLDSVARLKPMSGADLAEGLRRHRPAGPGNDGNSNLAQRSWSQRRPDLFPDRADRGESELRTHSALTRTCRLFVAPQPPPGLCSPSQSKVSPPRPIQRRQAPQTSLARFP